MPSSKRGAQQTALPTSIVSVRLTHPDRQIISDKADQCRMPISAFMRAAALGESGTSPQPKRRGVKASHTKRLPLKESQHIALILASLGRLMDSIKDYETHPVSDQDNLCYWQV